MQPASDVSRASIFKAKVLTRRFRPSVSLCFTYADFAGTKLSSCLVMIFLGFESLILLILCLVLFVSFPAFFSYHYFFAFFRLLQIYNKSDFIP